MSREKNKNLKNNFSLKFLKYPCDLRNFFIRLRFNGKIMSIETLCGKIQLSENLGGELICQETFGGYLIIFPKQKYVRKSYGISTSLDLF